MAEATLRLLIVEDSNDDTLMLAHLFQRGGYQLTYKQVDSAATMQAALNTNRWDAILADYAMPGFSGEAALQLLKDSGQDIPFILVSGAVGEEIAVEMMKAGAHDYVLKDRLHRLLPAVERAIQDANTREERRRLALELQGYNQYLEMLVAERTHELEEANTALRLARDEAIRALSIRNQILANTSHEARTPLSIILASLEALELGLYGVPSSAQQPIFHNMQQAAHRLQVFLNNMLDLASLESETRQLDYQPFAPAELVKSLEKPLKSIAQARQIHFQAEVHPELPTLISGDRERLWRVIYNLVENAIKFTDRGEVTLHLQPLGSENWCIDVMDTGIGLAPYDLEHLFETFWQKDGTSTRQVTNGVGLGLSVVRKFVDLMEGKIEVDSELNRGTHIRVIVPLLLTPAPSAR
jgi:signal transduction histidine kinase